MCTAADRVVQAINANGQKTAAKAKVVKFVVCKEQCTPGDAACRLPALCASKKTVTNCRMARCKVPWYNQYGDMVCPQVQVPASATHSGGSDYLENADWVNTDPCTKYAHTALAMLS